MIFNRIILKKLLITDSEGNSKSIDFSSTATVIYGHSNTGKTYIRDLIDFILGSGEELREVNEARKYSLACLEFEVDKKSYTLVRYMRGGEILLSADKIVNLDLKQIDNFDKFKKLTTRHGSNGHSISEVILQLIGMKNVKILNDSDFTEGSKKNLSLRNLVKLNLITEQQIISSTPPIYSAAVAITEHTTLKTAFTYLMSGIDYSNAILKTPTNVVKEARVAGRKETLKGLVKELKDARKISSPRVLDKKLLEVTEKVEQLQSDIGSIRGSVSEKEQQRLDLSAERRRLNERTIFLTEQIERFNVLHQSYISDLDRLDGTMDAARTLESMGNVDCPVCGAEACYQSKHNAFDTTALLEACTAEAKKISLLENDLIKAIADNRTELEGLKKNFKTSNDSLTQVETELTVFEKVLTSSKLKELEVAIEERQQLKSDIQYLVSITNLRNKYSIMPDPELDDDEAMPAASHMSIMPQSTVLEGLAKEIKRLLTEWKLINQDGSVHIDEQGEMFVDGKKRRDCGKGVRAMYHASFNIGLLNYCLDNNLPHPGFVVIDSPLTSHKGDDVINANGEISDENRIAFYESLEKAKYQTIIIDNYGPPKTSLIKLYYFEKAHGFA